MQLSAPIHVLKRKAKVMARDSGLALHQALDRVAVAEGYRSWSHLSASTSTQEQPGGAVLARLRPGELCLIGARPGQGKTLLGLELALRASQLGRRGFFFTLDYHARDVADRLRSIGPDVASAGDALVIDTSDDVSADHIVRRLRVNEQPALVVVDYLQLLDQKRTNPDLQTQMAVLRDFADETGAICVVISQIDRSFDLSDRPMPDVSDIRLPNPLDLSVFDRFFFLHGGRVRMDRAA